MRLPKIAIVKTVLFAIFIATSAAFVEVDIFPNGTMATSPTNTTPSSTWPEKSLIGMTGSAAKLEISNVDLTLQIEILPEDAMMTMDYREDRVRIFVDADGNVVSQPQKG